MAYQLGLSIDGHYKFAVNCSWFQETFRELSDRADEPTIRRYAQAYIMMLFGTQLFGDKSGTRIHIRWLSYVARLENMGGYSWRSAALSWLYWYRPAGYDTFGWHLASRWSGHNPTASEKGPRVFIWMPYNSHDVVQFGGVQPRPRATLDIDFLTSKDDRGGDHWFHIACSFGTFIGTTGEVPENIRNHMSEP
ncbi:uncharacterized protein DS421_8g244700 [Arachis hypogaea]|nr:uncharacterized protein DS421_8g244700 [Arachis hypogaea]